MEINEAGLEELKELRSDFIGVEVSEYGHSDEEGMRRFVDAYPILAGMLDVFESGAAQPQHDLARWPMVDGIDCSPENVTAWVDSSHDANGRALMWADKYVDLLCTIRSRAEDVLREVSELEGDS